MLRLRAHDTVRIRSGKDRGKTGKIVKVLTNEGRIVVEGLNLARRHTKPTPKQPHGGIVSLPAPLDASKATLICPVCSQPTRVAFRRTASGGVRICKACQAAIPTPRKATT